MNQEININTLSADMRVRDFDVHNTLSILVKDVGAGSVIYLLKDQVQELADFLQSALKEIESTNPTNDAAGT
jgi:reverse gyrase